MDKYLWDKYDIFTRINLYHLNNHTIKPITYNALSFNSNIPFSYVLKHKYEHWNWEGVIATILTDYDYHCYQDECDEIFKSKSFTYCEHLSVSLIYELCGLYNFKNILLYKAPLKFILEHPDYEWDWDVISESDIITPNDMISHPELPWKYNDINDPSIDLYLKLILLGYTYRNTKKLSSSKYIDINDVISNPDIPWDYDYLSMNPNITWEIITSYPDLPWNLKYIAQNTMSCPVECKYYRSLYDEIIHELNY